MRADILDEGKRIAGRKVDEVRAIETEVSVLEKPHGSSLFTRGETQVMATVTIGGKEGEQMSDSIRGVSFSKFYLHYTFAPYSVGEARGYRGVGRREVGHGNLAERALKQMLPTQEDFPYTIRIACEVLESNGSSSMGSVCSGSMALMDAGVPMIKPVAGIAMGLIKDGEKFTILTDILGDEDHLGDMDFKVAGTTEGITAIQMDIKITGITNEIFENSMTQAKAGRLHILAEMDKTIAAGRSEFKEGVPQIKTTKIKQDKIGALIGPGGKNIKAIQEGHNVSLEVQEDGTVKVLGSDVAVLDEVIALIDMQINGPAVGSEYDAVVVTIKEYGAFVDIAKGVSGLVHVSEFADERVNDPNEYVSEGDNVKVKVLEVDRFGKMKLSCKAIQPLTKK
jgi:polyribonucleotide nucleotidyltransferase